MAMKRAQDHDTLFGTFIECRCRKTQKILKNIEILQKPLPPGIALTHIYNYIYTGAVKITNKLHAQLARKMIKKNFEKHVKSRLLEEGGKKSKIPSTVPGPLPQGVLSSILGSIA